MVTKSGWIFVSVYWYCGYGRGFFGGWFCWVCESVDFYWVLRDFLNFRLFFWTPLQKTNSIYLWLVAMAYTVLVSVEATNTFPQAESVRTSAGHCQQYKRLSPAQRPLRSCLPPLHGFLTSEDNLPIEDFAVDRSLFASRTLSMQTGSVKLIAEQPPFDGTFPVTEMDNRKGFQWLVAEVGLGNIGIVLGLELPCLI